MAKTKIKFSIETTTTYDWDNQRCDYSKGHVTASLAVMLKDTEGTDTRTVYEHVELFTEHCGTEAEGRAYDKLVEKFTLALNKLMAE